LDHAEGDDRAGECVTVSTGADEWVDVARQISLRGDVQWKDEKAQKDDESHVA